MQLRFTLGLALIGLPLTACGGGDAFSTRSGAVDAGTGGSAGGRDGSSAGGGTSTGGATSAGGATSTGGATSPGDAASTGGATSTGDAASTGGGPGAGGATSTDGGVGAGGGIAVEAGSVDAGVPCGPVEICGDGVDNDCNGKTDEGCSGLGTWVSALTGDDQNPGTQQQPLKTIGAGIKNAFAIGGGADVYVGEGQYDEKVTLVDGISLLGGYSCTGQACSWARAPGTYKSEIINKDFEGVLVGATVGRQTLLDGFTITGLDGSSAVAPGNVGVTVLGGAATIVRNRIVGGSATAGGFVYGQSVGVAVLATSSPSSSGPLIDSNVIRGGDSTAVSIGIAFEARPAVTGQTLGTVSQNVISGGSAPSTDGILAWTSNHSVTVRNNAIWAGQATGSGGTAWAISVSAAMTIDSNVINRATGGTASCAAALAWCGGIQSQSSVTIITNNVISGASSTLSAGVSLEEAEKPAGAVILNSNYIDGGGAGGALSSSAAIRLRIGTCNSCGFVGKVGRIRNDILVGGKSGARFALLEDPPSGKQQHPEAFENNQLYVAARGTGDALYRYNDGSTATNLNAIATINALGATINGTPFTANQEGDPMVDSTVHLLNGSPCIDLGTSTEAPARDFERDDRPQRNGFDIGPDEAK